MRRRPNSTSAAPRPLARRPKVRSDAVGLGSWLRERLYWVVGLVLLALGLIYLLRSVFAVLFTSIVLAYLLDPVVDRFEARGMRRETGIGLLFSGALLALALVLLVVLPSVAREFTELSGNVGTYIGELKVWLSGMQTQLEQRLGVDIPLSLPDILDEIQSGGADEGAGGLAGVLKDAAPNVGKWVAGLLTTTLSGGFNFLVTVLNLALLPIFTFYLLRDWDRLIAATDDLIPLSYRPLVRRMAGEIDVRLGSFVRGQLTICLILGVLYSAGLLLSGIDLAIVVGMMAGILFIVPYLGTVVGVVLATALAVLKFGVDGHLLMVWGTFAVVQGLEGFLLTPRIMGDKVGLHPLVVMLALLVGGNLFGIWGMLFAIPATAAGQLLVGEWLHTYRASRFFSESA